MVVAVALTVAEADVDRLLAVVAAVASVAVPDAATRTFDCAAAVVAAVTVDVAAAAAVAVVAVVLVVLVLVVLFWSAFD